MAKTSSDSKFVKGFYWVLFILFIKPFIYLKYGYHVLSKYKIKKGEPVFVLSNHQTDLDPIFVHYSFNRILNTVATDTIFRKGIVGRTLRCLGAIPKKKGLVDLATNISIVRSIKRGDSVLLFAEGNRIYADFQFFISEKITKLVRSLKCPVILYNVHGGTGVLPRFAHKRRKGKMYGEIRLVLRPEECSSMSDDELADIIISNLRVIDAESNELYKSNIRAEYLERMFFICPHCGAISSLESEGNNVKCTKCNFEMEFGEDLKLHRKSEFGPDISMKDWYNLQKKWTLDYSPKKNENIFVDEDVELYMTDPYQKRIFLAKGRMVLNDNELTFGDIKFPLGNIIIASPISGTRLAFSDNEHSYLVKGEDRFNPLKYVLMFNRLETAMKISNNDHYYRLEVIEK